MRSLLFLALIGTVSTQAGAQEIVRGELPSLPPVTYHPEPAGYEVETFARDLEIVWALEFASDGRLFLTERPGRIRTISRDGTLDPEPWLEIEDRIFHRGESGLMGLALHPQFPDTPWVYITYATGPDEAPEIRLSRFQEADGRAGDEEVLIAGIPAQPEAGNHAGGTIRFGPDGMLYVATGDAFERERAGDPEDLPGSVLRLTPEGDVPSDNPDPENPVWAHGLRNVHGIDWQPSTGLPFAADHGPTGEDDLMHHDRVLVLEGGEHHGWPEVVGAPGMADYVDPILVFVPSAPPGDLLFYGGDLMPELRENLFVSVLGFTPEERQTLIRIRLDDPADPTRPTALERWFNDEDGNSIYGRLRGMTVGPDGALYVGTSNRDGRLFGGEQPRDGDDRILRIAPASE